MNEFSELLQDSCFVPYLLMNKNRPIYKFRFVGDNDVEILDTFEKPPFWIHDLRSWLRSRSSAKCRVEISKFLSDNDADTLKGFTILTRCFSLNDTLWVKREGDSAMWEQLNPYRNPFEEILVVKVFSDTSYPICSTDGQFPKCWVRRNGRPVLIKEGRAGFEPFAESFVSMLRVQHAKVVKYLVEQGNYLPHTVCECFTSEKVSYLPFSTVSQEFTLSGVSGFYIDLGYGKEFFDMLLLDAVSINVNRHFRNFGVLIDSDNYDILGMAPVFDMNHSFRADSLYDLKLPIKECVDNQTSDMFGSFIESIKDNINLDSLYYLEKSLKSIDISSLPGCEEWLFDRMVGITKLQIAKIKDVLK